MRGNEDREPAFIEEIKKNLQAKDGKLDPEILAKLSAIQGRVIEERGSGFAPLWRIIRLPCLALFTAGLIVAFTLIFFRGPATMRNSFAGLDKLDILVAPQEPGFYADLDFYSWLAKQRRESSPPGTLAPGKPAANK